MKEEDLELYNRLVAVLDHLGCDKNISKFAKGLGINSQNISNIYKRQTIPKLNLIAKIATHYPNKVNYHWLLTGQGDMLIPRRIVDVNNPNNDMVYDVNKGYQSEADKLLNDYLMQLGEKNQTIIALQSELNQAKQKTIELLEKQLEG